MSWVEKAVRSNVRVMYVQWYVCSLYVCHMRFLHFPRLKRNGTCPGLALTREKRGKNLCESNGLPAGFWCLAALWSTFSWTPAKARKPWWWWSAQLFRILVHSLKSAISPFPPSWMSTTMFVTPLANRSIIENRSRHREWSQCDMRDANYVDQGHQLSRESSRTHECPMRRLCHTNRVRRLKWKQIARSESESRRCIGNFTHNGDARRRVN